MSDLRTFKAVVERHGGGGRHTRTVRAFGAVSAGMLAREDAAKEHGGTDRGDWDLVLLVPEEAL